MASEVLKRGETRLLTAALLGDGKFGLEFVSDVEADLPFVISAFSLRFKHLQPVQYHRRQSQRSAFDYGAVGGADRLLEEIQRSDRLQAAS